MVQIKELTSWLGVFKKTGLYEEVDSMNRLKEMVFNEEDFDIVGSMHSYNSLALKGYKSVKLVGEDFKGIEFEHEDEVRVGAAVTVEELMSFLLEHGCRLRNSGNHRKQTVVGAILGGTHGFGPNASLASSVVDYHYVGEDGDIHESDFIDEMPNRKYITSVVLLVEEIGSYRVKARQITIFDLKLNPGERKAFLILPYTRQKDLMCIETCYYKIDEMEPALFNGPSKAWSIPWSAWKLKIFWSLDKCFPCFRSLLQKVLSYIKIPSWSLVTDPYDIDSLYHPWPGIDDINNKPRFSLWAFKPTYTGYNISLFFEEKEFRAAIFRIIGMAKEKKYPRNFLYSFIGCRYLSDKSNVSFVGNYNKRMVAVDIYCKPKHADHLIDIQRRLQDEFNTRSHRGKTV